MTDERQSRTRNRTKRTENIDMGLTIDQLDIENDPKFHADQYLPEDFPDIKIPPYLDEDSMPEFIINVKTATFVSDYSFFYFMRKFGLLYLQSEFVRQHTDGWHFLFFERNYYGVFSTREKLANYASRFNKAYFIISMYIPIIGIEFREFTSLSYGVTNHVEVDGKFYPYHTHDYYKINCKISFGNNEDQTPITENENYTVDSGCTVTTSLFPEYISNEYVYCEYPFNQYNEMIEEEEYRKEFFPFVNEQIISREKIKVQGISGFLVEKMLFIYREDTFFCLNDGIYVKLDSTTFPIIPKESNNTVFSSLTSFVKTTSRSLSLEKKKPIRPHYDLLLGMNILKQIEIQTKLISEDVSILIMKHPKIYELPNPSFRRYDGNKSNYEVYSFDEGMVLYCRAFRYFSEHETTINFNNINFNELDFFFTEEQLSLLSDHNDLFLKLTCYRDLNLANLLHYKTEEETKREISILKKNRNIDGFIIKQFFYPHSIQVKLLNIPFNIELIGKMIPSEHYKPKLDYVVLSKLISSIFYIPIV